MRVPTLCRVNVQKIFGKPSPFLGLIFHPSPKLAPKLPHCSSVPPVHSGTPAPESRTPLPPPPLPRSSLFCLPSHLATSLSYGDLSFSPSYLPLNLSPQCYLKIIILLPHQNPVSLDTLSFSWSLFSTHLPGHFHSLLEFVTCLEYSFFT